MALEGTEQLAKKVRYFEELTEMRMEYGIVDEEKTTDGVPVWEYAISFEYGRQDQSVQVARPFFRTVLWDQKDVINAKCKREFNKVMNLVISPLTAYKNVGKYLKAAIESSLLDGGWAALKESTVKAKKGDDTVGIDTGNMLNCIGYVIYKGDSIIYKEIGRGG